MNLVKKYKYIIPIAVIFLIIAFLGIYKIIDINAGASASLSSKCYTTTNNDTETCIFYLTVHEGEVNQVDFSVYTKNLGSVLEFSKGSDFYLTNKNEASDNFPNISIEGGEEFTADKKYDYQLTTNKKLTKDNANNLEIAKIVFSDHQEYCKVAIALNYIALVDTNKFEIEKTALDIDKRNTLKEVNVDDTFYYRIRIKNTSVIATDSITITDTIPDDFTVLDTEVYKGSSLIDDNRITNNSQENNINLKIDSLEKNETIYVYVKVQVKQMNRTKFDIVNNACGRIDENVCSENTIKILSPNLKIVKTAQTATLRPLDTSSYKLVVTNNGNVDLNNVLVKDSVNTNFKVLSVTADKNITNSTNNNEVAVTIPSLKINEQATITINYQVLENATLGKITNKATVETDKVKAEDTEDVDIVNTDLNITKVAHDESKILKPNDEFYYEIKISNSNSATTSSGPLAFSDSLDANLIYNAQKSTCDKGSLQNNGNNISWTHNSLDINETATCQIYATVANTVNDNTKITNHVILTENGIKKDEAQDDITVGKPNLSIVKSTSNKFIKPGQKYSYTIQVKNSGSVAATNVKITDQIDKLLEINDFTGKNSYATESDNKITWTIENINSNQTINLTVNVTLSPEAKKGTNIVNTAVGDFGSSSTENEVIDADLNLNKSVNKTKALPGEEVTYTLTVANNGTAPANNLKISDTLPNELEYVRTSDNCSYNVDSHLFTCQIDYLDINQELSFSFVAKVKENLANYPKIKNVAILEKCSDSYTNCTKDKEDETTTTVIQPNITVVKKSSVTKIFDDTNYFYTIIVSNDGDADANNLTITDTFDDKLKIVSAYQSDDKQNTATIKDNTLTWQNISIKANSSISFTINVKADGFKEGTIINNKVKVENDKITKEDEVDVEVIKPNLEITKEVNKNVVAINEEFEYLIKIKNNSAINVENALITDVLDPDLEIVDTNAQIKDNTLTWQVNIPANATVEIPVIVKIRSTAKPNKIKNIATLGFKNQELNSNEVVVDIAIENPKTGSVINYIIISLLGIGALTFIIYNTKSKKIFKI